MTLTATRASDGIPVLARDVERSAGPFICRGCGATLVLKKGRRVVHHFAHTPPVTCSWGAGESAQHLEAKLAIYDSLVQSLGNPAFVHLEYAIGTDAKADILACINNRWVAIEVQRSALTANLISHRTKVYHSMGVPVLWVALKSPSLNSDHYNPQEWKKWCHFAYFGRVYYWSHGAVVTPYHYGDTMLTVQDSSWYEGGDQRSAGGYDRRSLRWRTPKPGVPVSIAHHFTPRTITARTTRTMQIPECTLLVDGQEAWWATRNRPAQA